jgi:hypothetical protein
MVGLVYLAPDGREIVTLSSWPDDQTRSASAERCNIAFLLANALPEDFGPFLCSIWQLHVIAA